MPEGEGDVITVKVDILFRLPPQQANRLSRYRETLAMWSLPMPLFRVPKPGRMRKSTE